MLEDNLFSRGTDVYENSVYGTSRLYYNLLTRINAICDNIVISYSMIGTKFYKIWYIQDAIKLKKLYSILDKELEKAGIAGFNGTDSALISICHDYLMMKVRGIASDYLSNVLDTYGNEDIKGLRSYIEVVLENLILENLGFTHIVLNQHFPREWSNAELGVYQKSVAVLSFPDASAKLKPIYLIKSNSKDNDWAYIAPDIRKIVEEVTNNDSI